MPLQWLSAGMKEPQQFKTRLWLSTVWNRQITGQEHSQQYSLDTESLPRLRHCWHPSESPWRESRRGHTWNSTCSKNSMQQQHQNWLWPACQQFWRREILETKIPALIIALQQPSPHVLAHHSNQSSSRPALTNLRKTSNWPTSHYISRISYPNMSKMHASPQYTWYGQAKITSDVLHILYPNSLPHSALTQLNVTIHNHQEIVKTT